MSQPIPKFKIGDIVTINPYRGNSDSAHNIGLSKRYYEEVRLKGKAVVRKTNYNPYNEYGVIYNLENTDYVFHESVLLKVHNKIKY